MMLLFLSVFVQYGLSAPAPQVELPLNWGNDTYVSWGHSPPVRSDVVNWVPVWLTLERDILKSRSTLRAYQTKETNLGTWGCYGNELVQQNALSTELLKFRLDEFQETGVFLRQSFIEKMPFCSNNSSSWVDEMSQKLVRSGWVQFGY